MEIVEYDKMDRLEKSHPWFIAKRNFLLYALQKYAAASARILDIGCGTGGVMSALKAAGYNIEGVDPSDDALDYCRKKGLIANKATAENTDQADGSFDVVIALDVFEHLADDRLGAEEIRRILKPGGLAIITVPAHQALFSNHDKQLHHFRRYGKIRLKKLFAADFELVKMTWLHSTVLLPLALKRLVQKNSPKQADSDVGEVGTLISGALNLIYSIELAWLKIFGALPWGLSLMVIARKKI